jgi:DNA adenine methylase
VNSAGLFNVAFGKYVQPKICDSDNLVLVAHLLKRAEILLGDFESVLDFVQSDSFIYLDPPYRPLTETANFTAYSPTTFTALDQQRLAALCNRIHSRGAKLLMSNSDPTNIDPSDSFFEQTYPGFHIVKATANRMVNCRADRRGKISELLLMNYSDVGR